MRGFSRTAALWSLSITVGLLLPQVSAWAAPGGAVGGSASTYDCRVQGNQCETFGSHNTPGGYTNTQAYEIPTLTSNPLYSYTVQQWSNVDGELNSYNSQGQLPSQLTAVGFEAPCMTITNNTAQGIFIPLNTPTEFERFLQSNFHATGHVSFGVCSSGACGSANGGSFASLNAGSPNLCVAGSSVLGFASTGSGWTWRCGGIGGGPPSGNCTATQQAQCPVMASWSWGSCSNNSYPFGPGAPGSTTPAISNTAAGYTGSATFTCQSNGSWAATAQTCNTGSAGGGNSVVAGMGLCTWPQAGHIGGWFYSDLAGCVNIANGIDNIYGILNPGNVVTTVTGSPQTDVHFFPPAGVTCTQTENGKRYTGYPVGMYGNNAQGQPEAGTVCHQNGGSGGSNHMTTDVVYTCTGTSTDTGQPVNWSIRHGVYYESPGCRHGGCNGWGDYSCPEIVSFPSAGYYAPSCNPGPPNGQPGDVLCANTGMNYPNSFTAPTVTNFSFGGGGFGGSVQIPSCTNGAASGGFPPTINASAACDAAASPLSGGICGSGHATGVCDSSNSFANCTCQ